MKITTLDTGHYSFSIQDILFFGKSRAGVATYLAAKDLKCCFDVGYGDSSIHSSKKFFITHGHMDHASGIPYIISQKALNQMPAGEFYMPSSLVEPMKKIIEEWQKIEGHTYNYKFIPMGEGDEIFATPNYSITSFKTVHRVDSQGYAIWNYKKKLKRELQFISQPEIIARKNMGEAVDDVSKKCIFAFSGDTTVDFLENHPFLWQAEVLMLEVTYINEKRGVKTAREWGHLHLYELLGFLPKLQNKVIIIKHISRRHSRREVEEELVKHLSVEERSRIQLFGL